MILLVDNTLEGMGSSPREIRSALQQIEPDLRVVTEPFQNITPEFVKTLAPSHIILSGQSHPWGAPFLSPRRAAPSTVDRRPSMATQRKGSGVTRGNAALVDVIKGGDRLRSLEAIRDKLAGLIESADDKTAPALALRLSTIMAEIDALSGPAKESKVEQLRDDLAAQRAKRRPAAGS